MKKIELFSAKNYELKGSSDPTFDTLTRSGDEPTTSTSVRFDVAVKELSVTERVDPAKAHHISQKKLQDAIEKQQAIFNEMQKANQSGRLDAPKGKSSLTDGADIVVYDRAVALVNYYDTLLYQEVLLKLIPPLEEPGEIIGCQAALARKKIDDAKKKGVVFPGGEEKIFEKLFPLAVAESELIKILTDLPNKNQETVSSYVNIFENIEPLVNGTKVIIESDLMENTLVKWIGYSTKLEEMSIFDKDAIKTLKTKSIFTIQDLSKTLLDMSNREKIDYLRYRGVTIAEAQMMLRVIEQLRNKFENPILSSLPDMKDGILKILTEKSIITMDDIRAITRPSTNKLECTKIIHEVTGLILKDSSALMSILIEYGLFEYNYKSTATRSAQPSRG